MQKWQRWGNFYFLLLLPRKVTALKDRTDRSTSMDKPEDDIAGGKEKQGFENKLKQEGKIAAIH